MRMADDEIEATMGRMSKIREAVGNFRDDVAGNLRDMQVETKDWNFAVGSSKEGVTVDVMVKLLIKRKPKK
jgi:hypothetical protein